MIESPDFRTAGEIAAIRRSCTLAAAILHDVVGRVAVGKTTAELDRYAAERIQKAGARSAFFGEGGFPAALCCSVNHVAVHGVPGDTPLQSGDILGLDFGVIVDGWYSDLAVTVPVGTISSEAEKLLSTTREALGLGIAQARAGNRVGDISSAIQRRVERAGFQVIRELAGHGVGRSLHGPPQIANFGTRRSGQPLIAGMVIAIEPIVAVFTKHVKRSKDGQGYESDDGSLTAHFEHTVAITADGPEILTL